MGLVLHFRRRACRCAGRPPAAQPGAALAHVGEAHHRIDQVAVGGQLERIDAGAHEARAQLGFALGGDAGKALAKARVVGVHQHLLAGLGSRAWSAGRGRAGPAPADRAARTATTSWRCASSASGRSQPGSLMKSETTNTRRAALDHGRRRTRAGRAAASCPTRRAHGPRLHAVQQVQHVAPPAAGGDHRVHARAVEQRADAVAVAREHAREHGDELGRDVALALFARAEIDRRAQVQQEPGGHLAVFGEDAHMRHLQPRRHVPVDVAHVVVVLVLAQVGQVQARRRAAACGSRPAAGRRAGG